MSSTANRPDKYTIENIEFLCDLDHIRRRPGMFIGDTGEIGLHHLLWELIVNSAAEADFGGCRNICVDLLSNGGCQVRDDGRGIPVFLVEELNLHYLELAFTRIGSSYRPEQPYRGHSTLHGGGLVCVNSLSSKLVVDVCRDGCLWHQEFAQGKSVMPLRKLGAAESTGTTITFWPDPDIFRERPAFSFSRIREQLFPIACHRPGLAVHLSDHRVLPPLSWSFCSTDGIRDLLESLRRGLLFVHPTFIHGKEAAAHHEAEVAFCWTQSDEPRFFGLVNGQPVHTGTHADGITRGVSQVFRRKAWKGSPFFRNNRRTSLAQTSSLGLVAVVSLRLESPQFNMATREHLTNPGVIDIVSSLTRRTLDTFLREHPDDARAILAHLRDPRPADAKTGISC